MIFSFVILVCSPPPLSLSLTLSLSTFRNFLNIQHTFLLTHFHIKQFFFFFFCNVAEKKIQISLYFSSFEISKQAFFHLLKNFITMETIQTKSHSIDPPSFSLFFPLFFYFSHRHLSPRGTRGQQDREAPRPGTSGPWSGPCTQLRVADSARKPQIA